MHKVFVYGTLKQGGYNHFFVRGAKKYSAIAPKINLHAGPFYPFAIRGQGWAIGELYEVNEATLRKLDELEDHPNDYHREITRVIIENRQIVMAWIYLNRKACHYPRIVDGIWCPFVHHFS
jgi:gamma-glutamylaminecyclotransferase